MVHSKSVVINEALIDTFGVQGYISGKARMTDCKPLQPNTLDWHVTPCTPPPPPFLVSFMHSLHVSLWTGWITYLFPFHHGSFPLSVCKWLFRIFLSPHILLWIGGTPSGTTSKSLFMFFSDTIWRAHPSSYKAWLTMEVFKCVLCLKKSVSNLQNYVQFIRTSMQFFLCRFQKLAQCTQLKILNIC